MTRSMHTQPSYFEANNFIQAALKGCHVSKH